MRARILDASEKAFSEADFHSVQVETVASLAGVGKGTIYRYFRDKGALYVDTLTRAMGRVVSQMEEKAQSNGEPEARLRAALRALAEFFERDRGLLESMMRGQLALKEEDRRKLKEQGDRMNALLRSVVEEGISRSCFRGVNPALAAWVLRGACVVTMMQGPQEGSTVGAVEEICDIVLSGLRSH